MLARDLYSYLHLPMVAGIVLFALGMKTTLAHIDEPLDVISAVGLSGGLALYFAAHVAVRLRMGGGWGHGRPVATIVLLALVPVATQVPALVALALVSAVCVALIAYEAVRYSFGRAWIRSHRGAFTMEEAAQVTPGRAQTREGRADSTDCALTGLWSVSDPRGARPGPVPSRRRWPRARRRAPAARPR